MIQKIASHGLIRDKDKILVTRRSAINDWLPNLWDIPGGTIEYGEDPGEALEREILEETNLKVKVLGPIFVYSEVNGNRHQMQLVYECEYLTGTVKLNPEEHDQYKWVTVEELKTLPKIPFLESLYKNKLINNN